MNRTKDYEVRNDGVELEEEEGLSDSEADSLEKRSEGKESDAESQADDSDTGLTENQNRMLYLLSLYSRPAQTGGENEEWIRKSALMVLVYEGIVARTFDYDYAPSSAMVEGRRLYLNVSQEGKGDIDFLREEELVNGLKLASKEYMPVTCYQISAKGLDLIKKISKTDKDSVHELVYAPGSRELIRVRWDTPNAHYVLEAPGAGFTRNSTVTETEDVSYVSSAYVPQCLRHGGRPTLSNAHRAHESGDPNSTTIRDDLDEVITLNSVSLIVAEYVPFGANHIVQLNGNLGSMERVQGGFFTALVDQNSGDTSLHISPGLTSVHILDYSFTGHVNFEADIHFPEPPGIVQVETFGVSLNANGTCFYGMQLEAVMDRIKDNVSLDHLARLLVDVHVDTSKIVDSVLSSYQRSLLHLVFRGDAPNRDKVNLILCNEITPHLTAEEYMDKGEYENELKQVLGDTRAAYDISEHDTLVFGEHGILVAGPNSRHHEPLLCAYLQFNALDLFVRNFFGRMFLLHDDMKGARALVEEAEHDPTSLPRIRAHLAVISRHIIMLEETLGYLRESLDTLQIPPEPPEQAGRALFERLNIANTRDEIARRVYDLEKNIMGARRELEILQATSEAASARQLQVIHEEQGSRLQGLLRMQSYTAQSSATLEVMQALLAGLVAFAALDRLAGQWPVTPNSWGAGLTEAVMSTPFLWFFICVLFWALVAYLAIRLLRLLRYKDTGVVTLTMHPLRAVNAKRLARFLASKDLQGETRKYVRRGAMMEEEGTKLGGAGAAGAGALSAVMPGTTGMAMVVKATWVEGNPKAWGGVCPEVSVEYDETNGFLLQVLVSYQRRKARKDGAFNAAELQTRLMHELNQAGVFAADEEPLPDAGRRPARKGKSSVTPAR